MICYILLTTFFFFPGLLFFRLHKTQDLLYDSTKDFLELRFEHRQHERNWMQEKDAILQQLDVCKQQLLMEKDDILNVHDEALETRIRREEENKVLNQCHIFENCFFYYNYCG